MPGPPPTPTDILIKRGSHRGIYRKGEVMPEKGWPDCPFVMDDDPKQYEIWMSVCQALDTMGVLTRVDSWQLERYCRYFVRWREMEEGLSRLGPNQLAIFAKKETMLIAQRLNSQSRLIDVALKQIEKNFGLTPADRARLATTGGGEIDPDEDW